MAWRDGGLTLGQYDVVLVLELPDGQAVAKLAPQSGMRGNLSTQTLRAFYEEESDALLVSL